MQRIFFDGACAGNPGPIGVGVTLIASDGIEVDTYYAGVGEGTNNKAEYLALLAAFEMAKKHSLKQVVICGDSQLVIKQTLGQYQCNARDLIPLRDKAQEQLAQMDGVQLKWVPREKNVRADKLSKLGLQQSNKQSSRSPPPSEAKASASELFDDEMPTFDFQMTYHQGVGFSVVDNGRLYAINLRPLHCSCGKQHCRHIRFILDSAKQQRQ